MTRKVPLACPPSFPQPFAPWEEIVYLSGPYRAKTTWERELNITRARQAAIVLWRMGFVVICPHANTAHYDGALPDWVWLKGDLALVAAAHRLVLLPTWRRSSGAIIEAHRALSLGRPVWVFLSRHQFQHITVESLPPLPREAQRFGETEVLATPRDMAPEALHGGRA